MEFQFQHQSLQSRLISFRMDWLHLLAVQGLSSLLQHYTSKTSILQSSTFFIVQLSHPKMKSLTVSIVFPSICHEVMKPDAMILVFLMLSFMPTFSFSSFIFIKRLFSSSLYAIRVVSSAYLRLLIFLPEILIPSLCFIQPSIFHDVLCIEVK